MVPEDQVNDVVAAIQEQGYLVQKPDKPDKPDKPEHGIVWAYKPEDPSSWTPVEYTKGGMNELVEKLQASGFKLRSQPPTKSEGADNDYLKDKSKLVDDTRAFYQAKMNQFMDPLSKVVMDKVGYDKALKEMQNDMFTIANGGRPKWLQYENANLPNLPAGFKLD